MKHDITTKSFKLSTCHSHASVVGAGSWGIALSTIMSQNGHSVNVYTRKKEAISAANLRHTHPQYKNIILSPLVSVTNDFMDISGENVIFLAVPSQELRNALITAKNYINHSAILVIGCKGIENDTLLLMSDVIAEVLAPGVTVAVLSGPNFAVDIMKGLPSITTVASDNIATFGLIQNLLNSEIFRVGYSSDVKGVQLCGAIKNVMAIAAGIIKGYNMGDNMHAAFMTCAATEMMRTVVQLGGNEKTVMSAAGIGDLILTCSTTTSRNMSFGYKLAVNQNLAKKELLASTVEGYATTLALRNISIRQNITMPICEAVYKILYHYQDPKNLMVNAILSFPDTKFHF
ncbi:Glycerol-3-phosphate dehydrogenase (NAD(P)+) [Alphaproteobacteria bacterium]